MRKPLFYLLALLIVTACNDEFGNNGPNQSEEKLFGTNAKFLKLQDDSTDVAGTLEIMAQTPSVKLKWDVSPNCNLDTTITELRLSGGKCNLPIKWVGKSKNGTYGPLYSAYIAGVEITSGEKSQYVPLVWADEVDSLKMMETVEQLNIQTRAGDSRASNFESITINGDVPFQLDKDTCGKIGFEFSTTTCNVGRDELVSANNQLGYNLDLGAIKTIYFTKKTSLDLSWGPGGAPTVVGFMGHVKIHNTLIAKFAYFQYEVPDAKKWEFIECIPDTLSVLPAKDATVVAIANTNRKWSLRYRMEDGKDTVVVSGNKVSGEQSLLLRIPENVSLESKNILVDVYSQDTLKNTLRFTQKAAEGSFSIDSVVPSPADGHLSSAKQVIKVYVDTARDWWISFDGKKDNFLANQNEGDVEIPINDGITPRTIVVTVGYDNTLVGTYTYTQGIGTELIYNNSDMPTKIPVDGGTYTFLFTGTYVGNLQVRAVLNDGTTIVATSPSTTNKQPILTIPNNYNSREDRSLVFEFKKGTETWMPLNETRVQDKATFDFDVLPTTDIPRGGATVTGSFTGTFRSSIKMKAVSGDVKLAEKDGSTPGNINIAIPALVGTEDRQIDFFYSLDNGTTWITMGDKTQVAGTIVVGTVTPAGNIPAEGKTYSCSFSGTYPAEITFRARTGSTELDSQRGKLPIVFSLDIPANPTSGQRDVVFEYSKDGKTWILVDSRVQTSNIPVGGGGNEVGDFDKENDINGGAKL